MNLETIRSEYPFESNWFDIDGHKMHYLDEGDQDAPVVLMVHGNPTWSFYYRRLVKALKNEYRVIVPDHIGMGLSDKPQDYPYRIVDHSTNLGKFLEFLEIEDYFMVVHDWGGPIGFSNALKAPEKVSGLVVLNTAAFYLNEIPLRLKMCRWPIIGSLMVRGLNLFSIFAYYWAINDRSKRTPAVYAAYVQPYNNWANRKAVHRFIEEIPLEDGHHTLAVIEDLDNNLHKFGDTPMVIAWGDGDFVFTSDGFGAEFEKRFPQAEAHHFPDAGHYVLEDAYEEIVSIVKDFLGRNR